MAVQPIGTVTLLFTDIEGSTRLLQQLGSKHYSAALDLHRRLLREAFDRNGGYEVDYEGDSFFIAFEQAPSAVAAAAEAQDALAGAKWPAGHAMRVRMGIHTGQPAAHPPKYVGLDVHLAARIMAAGHGGQVLLSEATHALAGTPAADLGEHTVRDFDEPLRLYQLGGRRFPPLLTVGNTNLPRPGTSFIGRTRELAEVLELLNSARLVTLTGPGGTGKTRLALEAALGSIGDYPDGVWFVPLAPVTDGAFIEPAIAGAVGARGKLRDDLRSKRMLLLLDNLEQLRGAPPIVAGLLDACPDVRVLATSRERLNLSIEQEYPVPTLEPAAAAELFVQRALLRNPGFEPNGSVLEIARRLDGLPLAVELAAARIKVLTPAEILDRLDRSLDFVGSGPGDLPERQRTLRATLEWSYELLDDPERALFRRLGVFAGSFDLDAAEEVGGGDLDTLASLVDKSLVRPASGGRFVMLHILREYARERLDAAGEMRDVVLAHASYYRTLVERLEPQIRTARHLEVIARLEFDHANFVWAIESALESGEPELALDIFGRLKHVWWDRGREGWVLAQRVLPAAPMRPTLAHGGALHAASGLAWAYGDLDQALSLDEQALEIYEEIGDPVRVASTQVFLGLIHQALGRPDARAMVERGLAGLEAAGDEYGAAIATGNLGDFALQEEDFAGAARLSEDAAARAREHGFTVTEAMSTCNQAFALAHEAEPHAAEIARDALRLCAQTGMHLWIGNSLFIVAATIAAAEPRRAAVLLGAAETELQDARMSPVEQFVWDNAASTSKEALGVASFEESVEEGRLFTREQAVQLGLEPLAAPRDSS